MQPKDRVRLLHMFESARDVERYTSGKTLERYYEDEILRLALTALFQKIGEAARKISDEFKLEHSEIEWEEIIGFRHRLVHGYNVIDFDIMWDIIQNDIPKLLTQLRALDLIDKSF